jgi:RNA polymerase-binding transcription factor DksA
MADEIDLANDLIDSEVSRALRRMRKSKEEAIGTEFCVECGEGIPKERQELGFKLCVPCAEESERRRALFADE